MSSDKPVRSTNKPAPPDPMIGRVLADKFKIVSLIARGGMGKVYRAEQAPLGRTCAVKVLTPPENGSTTEEEFRKRFFLEASIGAKLTHPNTVTIFDYGVTEDSVYFIAMEYLEGKTLARVLKEEGAFTEQRAAHIARQICRSLREAHALGVIHRDLKPANVYLVEHGDEADVVKVLDFGLVKDVESDGEDLTQTGLFMGSPKYMAPEQIRGEHVDARTDVYALGVMLYEMVCGRVPYDKVKQVDTLLAHVNDRLPPLRDKKPDLAISEQLEMVILRALAKSPADRYASMGEVLECLKGAAGGTISATRTAELDALRASASFTPEPLAFRPHASGEIPAANPGSIAPPAAPQSTARRWMPVAVALVALAAVAVTFVTRRHEPTQPVAASDARPIATLTAPPVEVAEAAPKEAVKPAEDAPSITLESEPPGARVRDESKSLLCDKTPCKLRVGSTGLTVIVEQDGYHEQKVKLSAADPPRMVKLSKFAAAARPVAPKPTATATATAFKPDPYGGGASGPY